MEKIQLPTDSIYKFYALFGLLVLAFSIGAVIYVTQSTNDLIFQSMVKYEELNQPDSKLTPIEITKRKAIEKRVEIAIADKKLFLSALGSIAGISVIAMLYGFGQWHQNIQPIQDETAKLQLDKLSLELQSLRRNANNRRPSR